MNDAGRCCINGRGGGTSAKFGCVTKRRKRKYRLRNWPDYNSALVRRGSLTLWVDSRSLDSWLNRDSPARRGRRQLYADAAILCCLMLREVYHLPLRATEGLARSLLGLLAWKKRAKYHRRSLAETAIYRFKTRFSDKLRSSEVERQRAEVLVRCVALNRMSELGMPRSYAV